jgi:hypothetical protein
MEEYSDLILKEWTSGWENKLEGHIIRGDPVDVRDINFEETLKNRGIGAGIIKENGELPEKPEMNADEDKAVQKKISPEEDEQKNNDNNVILLDDNYCDSPGFAR